MGLHNKNIPLYTLRNNSNYNFSPNNNLLQWESCQYSISYHQDKGLTNINSVHKLREVT